MHLISSFLQCTCFFYFDIERRQSFERIVLSRPHFITLIFLHFLLFFSIFSFGGFLDFLRFLMEQRNFSRLPHLIQRHPCTLVIMKKLSPVPRVKLILSFELERLTDEGHFEVLCLYLVYVSHV